MTNPNPIWANYRKDKDGNLYVVTIANRKTSKAIV